MADQQPATPNLNEAKFSKGVEIRAEIDRDIVKGLMLLNGGGAVALLAFLPSIIDKQELRNLAQAILIGILVLMVGLVLTITHNVCRRECSRLHEESNWDPPKQRVLGFDVGKPQACFWSTWTRRLSVACFFLAGFLVAGVGLVVLGQVE
jgi:hypothetical protein